MIKTNEAMETAPAVLREMEPAFVCTMLSLPFESAYTLLTEALHTQAAVFKMLYPQGMHAAGFMDIECTRDRIHQDLLIMLAHGFFLFDQQHPNLPRPRFYKTYEYITDESAMNGDVEERGWVDPHGFYIPDVMDQPGPVHEFDVTTDWYPEAVTLDQAITEWIRHTLSDEGMTEGDGETFRGEGTIHDYSKPGEYVYSLHLEGCDSANYPEAFTELL